MTGKTLVIKFQHVTHFNRFGGTGDSVEYSSALCARRFLSSLPESEQQLCRLAEQSSNSDVSKMLRDTIITRNYKTEVSIRQCMMYIV